jgi:hypothetical protein
MPKGDRLKLKADPEDGTTPIANLLLEAVAMAKLSGLQKGAIIYLWRCTYGWVGENGKRRKEAKVSLSEWAKALDSASSRLSHALSELEAKSIINRRMADAWGGYYYSLNTTVAKWNSNCLNLAKLAERVGIADFGSVDESAIPPQNNNSCEQDNSSPKQQSTVDENAREQLTKTQPPTLYKERLNKILKKEGLKKSSPFGEDVVKVFYELDRIRGYRPTVKRKGEAASIIRMLKAGYTPKQIIEAWQKLKEDKFWQDKELFMMTVESQIGAVIKGVKVGTNQQRPPGKLPKHYTDPEDLRYD